MSLHDTVLFGHCAFGELVVGCGNQIAAEVQSERHCCLLVLELQQILAFSCLVDTLWELIDTCYFYTALRNNAVKEELHPLDVLSVEQITQAPHETQERRVSLLKEYVK